MIQKINRTETINSRLFSEGNVTYLDKPNHIAAIQAMNIILEGTRRDFQVKDKNSQIHASQVILTA